MSSYVVTSINNASRHPRLYCQMDPLEGVLDDICRSQEFRQSHLSHPKLFKPGCLKADTSSCSNTSETPQPIVITWEQSQDFGAYQALSSTLSLGTKKETSFGMGETDAEVFQKFGTLLKLQDRFGS